MTQQEERALRLEIGRVLANENDICKLWLVYGGTLASCPHGRHIEFNEGGASRTCLRRWQ